MKRRLLLSAALLGGCASAPPKASGLPQLRLPPAALGEARWALSQRLSVTRLDRPDAAPQSVEVQLQLDSKELLLAGFAYGQRVLLMRWDGAALQVQRHPMLPPEVDTDRMLRDLCLNFWPLEAVRAALPEGWAWVQTAAGQELRQDGQARLTLLRPSASIVEIVNMAEGYRLVIESQPQEGA
ncbi:DUF3261 domain-containing protein [Roseateles asaccharophilus]|uniref:DUF3261 domain-containing protein n=1 Tax=Roseateles asaccharophilus TaxID=582607 RepID=A0ABU2A6K8_9BURK|nr:DUF3261 domain-containing protein [Roseateles asaccharophilus]MDR7332791.1 hypothetical protein [Roseateles asaccharophilus]